MKILTFEVEEWFHILDNPSTKTEKEWVNFPSRIHEGMERIFDILDYHDYNATFFVLGWIAEKYPEIVRMIVQRGYEIGSHTNSHQLVYEQSKQDFYQDVDRSIKTLEDVSGTKVRMFRAPGFSITKQNLWAFEVLVNLGIEIDSSVFPAGRNHGGMPNYGIAEPSIIKYNGIHLKEFPINTHKLIGKNIAYSGGGYFRLIPYSLLKKWTSKDTYVMSYMHPRDFDFNQPMIQDLNLSRKFKSYYGLKTANKKFKKWLTDFHFVDIATADNLVNWNLAKQVKL